MRFGGIKVLSKLGKKLIISGYGSQTVNFTIGLEVERHRISDSGAISTFPYPKNIGDQKNNKWITNDFMETMSEVVTPPAKASSQALTYLTKISNILRQGLSEKELLWPLSMPPKLPKDRNKIDIAHTTDEKREYFTSWVRLHKHNIQTATPTGAHINISINNDLINKFLLDKEEINYLYLKMAQGFVKYRFLLTYLFGASPVAEKNYFLNTNESPSDLVRSIRQSKYGFGTKFNGDYSSIENYSRSITNGINQGYLLAEHDFHGPVRFKGTDQVLKLSKQGVSYLELRMLDLDPWSSIGINEDELNMIKLMGLFS